LGILEDLAKAINSGEYLKALQLAVANPDIAETIAKSNKMTIQQFLAALAENAIAKGANPIDVIQLLSSYPEAEKQVIDFAIDYELSSNNVSKAIDIAKEYGCGDKCMDLVKVLSYRALSSAINGKLDTEDASYAVEFGAPKSLIDAIKFVYLTQTKNFLDAVKILPKALPGLKWLYSNGILEENPINLAESVAANAVLNAINKGVSPEQALQQVTSVLPKSLVSQLAFLAKAKEIQKLITKQDFKDIPKIVGNNRNLALFALALASKINPSKLPKSKAIEYIEMVKELASVANVNLKSLSSIANQLLRYSEEIMSNIINSIINTVSPKFSKELANEILNAIKSGNWNKIQQLLKEFPFLSSIKINGIPLPKLVQESKYYTQLISTLSTLRNVKVTPSNALSVARTGEKVLELAKNCSDILKMAKNFKQVLSQVKKLVGMSYMVAALSALSKGDTYSANLYVQKAARYYIPKDLAILYSVTQALASNQLTLNDLLEIVRKILGPPPTTLHRLPRGIGVSMT